MDTKNPNLQSQAQDYAGSMLKTQDKDESSKWKIRYFLSIPIGFFISAILLYYYFIYSVEGLNDEAGIVTQFWILFSIILTPVFSFIIFTILNIIKNRRITKKLAITWATIIFFIFLTVFIIWSQANYLNK